MNLFIFTIFLFLQTQTENDLIREKILSVYNGNVEAVLKELPTLEKKYPQNPGLIYLKGILTIDGAVAVKLYEQVAYQSQPSEWGDDALYRIFEYNYAIGLYKKSDEVYSQLKEKFPNSEYLNIPKKQFVPEPQKIIFEKDESQKTEKISEKEIKLSPFAVQVGAFVSEENAKTKANYFKSLGKVTSIQKKQTTTNLFVVLIEDFETELAAREYIQELKSKNKIDAVLIKR